MLPVIELLGQMLRLPTGQENDGGAETYPRQYLAAIGRRGGLTSRRELTKSHARKMVAIRELKRAAITAGRPWPPRNRKLLKLR
jgi:hypothetical protein